MFKRSDLIKSYGKGSYTGPDAPVHVKNERITAIQGSNSKLVKYQSALCAECNNARTQAHDRAYDRFVDWFSEHLDTVILARKIDLEAVYESEENRLNLFRYFAKCFGCRLNAANEPVPKDLSRLILGESNKFSLRLAFAIHDDIRILPENDQRGYFAKGELYRISDNAYSWHEGIACLRIGYFYNVEPPEGFGIVWTGSQPSIELGNIRILSDSEREEIRLRLLR